jgi:hypothetical protein
MCGFVLVVVGYFYVVGVVSGVPCETNAIALIDANAVLSGTVAGKNFKVVAGWIAEGFEVRGVMYCLKSKQSSMGDVRRDFVPLSLPEGFGVLVGKRLNHAREIVGTTGRRQ